VVGSRELRDRAGGSSFDLNKCELNGRGDQGIVRSWAWRIYSALKVISLDFLNSSHSADWY
jgi:hypothetical protein